MNTGAVIGTDGRTITLEVPLAFRRRGGRKRIELPEGQTAWAPARRDAPPNTLVKAPARAHGWQRMLDSGEVQTVCELATVERVNASYIARTLRLTLLSPALAEALLDGHSFPGISLMELLNGFPVEWHRQAMCKEVA